MVELQAYQWRPALDERDSQPYRVYMMSHSPELFHFQPMINLLYRFSTVPKVTGFVLPNIGCEPNSIKVHDSNVTGDVLSSTKDALATLMCSQAKVIYILYPDVQQIGDNSSSSLYVKDPTNVAYSEVNLKSHLLMCLKCRTVLPSHVVKHCICLKVVISRFTVHADSETQETR